MEKQDVGAIALPCACCAPVSRSGRAARSATTKRSPRLCNARDRSAFVRALIDENLAGRSEKTLGHLAGRQRPRRVTDQSFTMPLDRARLPLDSRVRRRCRTAITAGQMIPDQLSLIIRECDVCRGSVKRQFPASDFVPITSDLTSIWTYSIKFSRWR